ncbi:histone acetyltransferase 1 [Xanthoria calcicola]
MADQEEWSSNANEALNISFVQAGQQSPVKLSTFHPKFTYPIFGEEECIFGYQGLNITVRFAAHDLLPNLSVKYDKKFKTVNDTEALNIEETLKEWMPEVSFEPPAEFNHQIQYDTAASEWKPPGELVESYQSRGRDFEIWCADLIDPAVRQLIDRIQILISLFIEGGTPIPLDDADWSLAKWRIFFVYERSTSLASSSTSPYSLVGYCSTYRFNTYSPSIRTSPSEGKTPLTFTLPPDATTSTKPTSQETTDPNTTPFSLSNLPFRARISQFLILPSHQSHSHGTRLYQTIYTHFLRTPACTEITVEDPNEAFDDLRDYCDYTHLLTTPTFPLLTLPTTLPPTLFAKRPGTRVPTAELLPLDRLASLRHHHKLAPRQFARLVEMHLLSTIPAVIRASGTARLTQKARAKGDDDRRWYYWRLLVKQRVYKRNRDVLAQLERTDRVEKCEETVGEVVGEYERLLRRMRERGGGDTMTLSSRIGVEGAEESEGKGLVNGMAADTGAVRRERGKKRKVVVEEESELEGTPEPKKVKEGEGG